MSEECCGGKKCCAGFAPEVVEELKSSAEGLGFGGGFISEVLNKWGPQALSLAVEALRQGFSIALVDDLLNKLGPKMLELVLGVSNTQKMLLAQVEAGKSFLPPEAQLVTLDGGDARGPVLERSILLNVLARWVPDLIRQLGPKLFDQLIQLLKDNEQKVIEYVAQAAVGLLGEN